MSRQERFKGPKMDRRSLMMLMAASGAAGPALAQAEPAIDVVNPKYRKFYDDVAGYYIKDPQWVKETAARLTWPQAGERVPEIRVIIPNTEPAWLDAFRKWSKDGEQLGLRYKLEQMSQARWLEEINVHRHGDIEVHPAVLRPERVDPAEWIVSRGYGSDRRNYGEWVVEQYDDLIDRQSAASDPAERLKLVREAARVMAEDLYPCVFGWGPSIIEAYNGGDWDNFVKSRGFGIGNFNAFLGFSRVKPKGNRKSLRVGMTNLLETTNLLGATNNMRAIGRMIYDRLAYYDENLNVIPWAVESWRRLDERTWDLTLRKGMEFHDGRPVTVRDLKFTLDFMVKYERGIFWTANRFLESAEIVDEANGVLRTRFKQPYGQFESYFMQLNVVLPQHIWGNIMEEQNTAGDPRRLRIDTPIGSGPYRFGRHRKDTELQLIANKKHFDPPQVDDIWVVVTPSLDGLMGRLESREIDVIESSNISLTPSQAAQLAKSSHVRIERTPDVNWLHGVVRASVLPWRDYEFRLAWQHSIDREFLVKVPWEGAGRVPKSNTFLAEGNPWHNPDLPAVPGFDLGKAREILRAAGYAWASDGRLVYPAPVNAGWRQRVVRVSKPGLTWGGLKMLGG
ncbi:MAG: hypothetical protein FJX46_01505 [Alphaproteobacteria bacterium]|nr:hypothetical protein [Alphaproteobacteria bacterium]